MARIYYVSPDSHLHESEHGSALIFGDARKIWNAGVVELTPWTFAGFLKEARQHGAADQDILDLAIKNGLHHYPAGRDLGFSTTEWASGQANALSSNPETGAP